LGLAAREGTAIIAIAVATTTTAVTMAATATGTAVFTRAGFIDGQVAATEELAVGRLNGGLAFRGAAHGHERETAGAAGGVIGHESDLGDGAVLAEEIFDVVFGGVEGEVSYVQFHLLLGFWRERIALAELFPRNSGFKSPLKGIHLTIHHARDK
jgi:hypothetical protein